MFTGLIQSLGKVVEVSPLADAGAFGLRRGKSIVIESQELAPSFVKGGSIAVNGACLTIKELNDSRFSAEISPETLQRTTLGKLTEGSLVNLELPVRADSLMGGHIVQGHVDAKGRIRSIEKFQSFWNFTIELPTNLAAFVVEKGSVCVDGVSLTVNAVRFPHQSLEIDVMIIPHTFEHTLFRSYSVLDEVNIEVDILAKYVSQALRAKGVSA